jgi:hypothetical protein
MLAPWISAFAEDQNTTICGSGDSVGLLQAGGNLHPINRQLSWGSGTAIILVKFLLRFTMHCTSYTDVFLDSC